MFFVLNLEIPRWVHLGGRKLDREDFYAWLWQEFGQSGLQGVHEGTLLADEAFESGLEVESWTVDSAEAPRERDWMAGQVSSKADLYFETEEQAKQARLSLLDLSEIKVGEVQSQEDQDWDAQWKAAFLSNPDGVQVSPCWRILPPWVSPEAAGVGPSEIVLKINPGAGFGTGTHETTQLCLGAMARAARGNVLWGAKVLDFGSGSGILSIGAALLGGDVYGVEIDPLANDNARENAEMNQIVPRVRFLTELSEAPAQFKMVIANILRPVLLEFADALVCRLEKEKGTLILSGLIATDLPEVIAAYEKRLGKSVSEVLELREWRALVWKL